jgi:glutamine synthetase
MNKTIALNKNAVVAYLQKAAAEFTRQDIIKYIVDNNVEMVNFMYPAADGRLKTLNFVINSLDYLETILTLGERVDGSSLFPFISAGSSDLYVIPRYRTAFVDPFAEIPTLTMLCSFCDKDGHLLESSPEYTLSKACREFTRATGMNFRAMGELEYYVIAADSGLFEATDQRGYHESAPFAKFNDFRARCMHLIATTGGHIKYGHSEVGNFTLHGTIYEQNEIEFLPVDAEDAADQLMLAKWVIRTLAWKEGLTVTFAPKITIGKAGSGLHIHMQMTRNGRNCMLDEHREISNEARRAIAGLMKLAPALTAFGNTNPTSYFRLVPHQEALVRVPLGWTAKADMCAAVNVGQATPADVDPTMKQTVEIRSADGSADVYQLLAGLAVALRYGLESEDALEVAARTYVDVNIHAEENAARLAALDSLPTNCAESADCLEAARSVFEDRGVFSPGMIDGILKRLRSYDQAEAAAAMTNPDLMQEIVTRHFHC